MGRLFRPEGGQNKANGYSGRDLEETMNRYQPNAGGARHEHNYRKCNPGIPVSGPINAHSRTEQSKYENHRSEYPRISPKVCGGGRASDSSNRGPDEALR